MFGRVLNTLLLSHYHFVKYPGNIYFFKVKKRNTGKKREIFSKLITIKTAMTSSGIFIVNLEHISQLFSISVVEFDQVNVS